MNDLEINKAIAKLEGVDPVKCTVVTTNYNFYSLDNTSAKLYSPTTDKQLAFDLMIKYGLVLDGLNLVVKDEDSLTGDIYFQEDFKNSSEFPKAVCTLILKSTGNWVYK